jgi:hypothetical protein
MDGNRKNGATAVHHYSQEWLPAGNIKIIIFFQRHFLLVNT